MTVGLCVKNPAGRFACSFNDVVGIRNLLQINVSGKKQATEAWFIKGQIRSYVNVITVNYSMAVKEYDGLYDTSSS